MFASNKPYHDGERIEQRKRAEQAIESLVQDPILRGFVVTAILDALESTESLASPARPSGTSAGKEPKP